MTNASGAAATERLSVGGMELEVLRRGTGRPVLLLHGMQNVDPRARFVGLLSRHTEIIAPSRPGFGHSARPADLDTVHDLVHLYLDVLDALPYERITLVGLSFGGWLAAEIAVQCSHRLDQLVLVDAFGIKISDRDIPDILLILGILARQTRKVRILSLGTLISLRTGSGRIAEEYATADVISRGRLEIGFVKSGGSEMASNNANPVNHVEPYWEAMDLITKALTHQEGPFRWEGKHYTHRHVNIWPRPWQQPHPRPWAATGDPATAGEVGRWSMVNILVLRGEEGAKRAWAAYRQAREEAGLPKVSTDHFAYAAMVYVGDTHEEGIRVGSKLLWFLNTSLKSAPQYSKFLPGAVPAHLAPQVYRSAPQMTAQPSGSGANGAASADARKPVTWASQNAATLIGITTEQAMARGILFAGGPDTVYQQIMDFYDKVGGFGHLVMIGRSGFMTHTEAEKGIKLFAKEVLPRL